MNRNNVRYIALSCLLSAALAMPAMAQQPNQKQYPNEGQQNQNLKAQTSKQLTPQERSFLDKAAMENMAEIEGALAGDRPVGHLETDALAWGRSPEEATERLGALSLYDVKSALAEAIARAPAEW